MATLTFNKSGPAPEPEPTPPAPEKKVEYANFPSYRAEVYLGQAITGGNYREKAMMRCVQVEFNDETEFENARFRLYNLDADSKPMIQLGENIIRVAEITYARFFIGSVRREVR